MKKSNSSEDNVELINQDQLSNNMLESIRIDTDNNTTINKNITSKSFADIFCEAVLFSLFFIIFFVLCAYLGLGIMFGVFNYTNNLFFLVKYDCINILSPCFIISGLSVSVFIVLFTCLFYKCVYID